MGSAISRARLIRWDSTDEATLGALYLDDHRVFWTCENPWKNNVRNLSCIPKGIYTCQKILSPRFGQTYEITNVPNRSEIIFHVGNTVDDTRGCILLGTYLGQLNQKPAVLGSAVAMGEFRQIFRTERMILEIL